MSIPNVNVDTGSVAMLIQTINEVAQREGDLTTLVTVDKSTLVGAVNEVRGELTEAKRRIAVYSIAMS